MKPRYSSGRVQLAADWPTGSFLVPSGTILHFSDWKWNGHELGWPPPPTCLALDEASYKELLKHYPPHMLSFRPETQKFGGEERQPREASKMSMEQSIERAVELSKSLPQMADQLIAALQSMLAERDAIEEDLNKKREQHQKVEANLDAARRELADIEGERKRIHGMFTRLLEKSDAA